MSAPPPDPLDRPTYRPGTPPRHPVGVRPWAIALAVVLTIAAMAGVLVYFGALFSGPTGTPGPLPCDLCGTTFAVGAANPGMNGSAQTYTMAMTPSSTLLMGSLSFEVQTGSGANLTLPQSNVQVVGPTGCLVGEFTLSTQSWSNGPVTAPNACSPPGTTQTQLTSAMALVLSTGTSDLRGQGDVLWIGWWINGTGWTVNSSATCPLP
jgi:hypothetical protein